MIQILSSSLPAWVRLGNFSARLNHESWLHQKEVISYKSSGIWKGKHTKYCNFKRVAHFQKNIKSLGCHRALSHSYTHTHIKFTNNDKWHRPGISHVSLALSWCSRHLSHREAGRMKGECHKFSNNAGVMIKCNHKSCLERNGVSVLWRMTSQCEKKNPNHTDVIHVSQPQQKK